MEEREVEELGCGDTDAGAFLEEGGGKGFCEVDLGEGAVLGEAGVVTVIAQVVEGFVGVFDCDF